MPIGLAGPLLVDGEHAQGEFVVPMATTEGTLVGDDVAAQTEQVFRNIRAVLATAGVGLGDVVKTTVYLDTMDDFKAMNAVYAEAFGDHRPARSTVAVDALPVGALVEIEVIAEVG